MEFEPLFRSFQVRAYKSFKSFQIYMKYFTPQLDWVRLQWQYLPRNRIFRCFYFHFVLCTSLRHFLIDVKAKQERELIIPSPICTEAASLSELLSFVFAFFWGFVSAPHGMQRRKAALSISSENGSRIFLIQTEPREKSQEKN